MTNYIENPYEIERKSFEIIQDEMHNTDLPPLRLAIMKRVIHTTTDFIYEDILWFKDGAEERIKNGLKNGAILISDTQMIKAGISKKTLDSLGVNIECFVSEEEIGKLAKQENITRSMAAVDHAFTIKKPKIFVIGNAPTALYRIMEKIEQGDTSVIAVIGVPVGFVGAAESKEALWSKDISSIITVGRKGGSTIAVAIINAILKEIDHEE